ncbi:metal-dependent hydrolase [Candidatus Woesearchaeota archaeon]|nr:metal-dependent hydrolase [Candidatus Woesearchaeota archaeon]
MPLAVTHVLTSVVLIGLWRDYVVKHKKYFTLHTVFLAGFFALLPDIDVPLRMITEFFGVGVPGLLQHGGITHTPFFAVLFLIPAVILWKKKKKKQATYFYVAVFAIILHILFDYILGGGAYEGIMWLFPFSLQAWKLHILNYFGAKDLPMALDAIILLGWLWHEEVKHKISDFV